MPDVSKVISFTDAAEVKQCGRNTLYRAVEDGRLNDIEVGSRRMLVEDEKWDAFEPESVGLRAQKPNNEDSEEPS
ncbi:hypothetical protein [Salinibacter ruber]|uniref:hypothetical protein n=1 Tax=Salinibacter ruber TaxID=146919 RepID=UPI0021689616|nr:hypothetical protein [Salinibacter ruber]MCS3615879.1 hypothetical protein [Salinibacter ruber]